MNKRLIVNHDTGQTIDLSEMPDEILVKFYAFALTLNDQCQNEVGYADSVKLMSDEIKERNLTVPILN